MRARGWWRIEGDVGDRWRCGVAKLKRKEASERPRAGSRSSSHVAALASATWRLPSWWDAS